VTKQPKTKPQLNHKCDIIPHPKPNPIINLNYILLSYIDCERIIKHD